MSRIVRTPLGRLGKLVARRKELTKLPTTSTVAMDGKIVKISPEDLPLSGILDKTRRQGRVARDNDYLHVSDLVGKCIRKVVLIERVGMSAKPQGISFYDDIAFAQGTAIHDVVKRRAANGSPEQVWGLWRCECGLSSTKTPGLLAELQNEEPCTFCKRPLDIYKELPVFDHDHKIVGNPDLITLLAAHRALHVSELKSISHDRWKDLARPIPDHIIQTIFYWRLLKELKYRLTDRVSILYVSKGWLYSGNPYKEFTLNAPDNLHRLDELVRSAREAKIAREGGDLPSRICKNAEVTEAKNCEVCGTCFGITNEAPIKLDIASARARAK